MKKYFLLTFIAFLSFNMCLYGQTSWALDKGHSSIGFSAKHMGISKTAGNFIEFDGSVTSSSDDFNGATVEFWANTSTVNTGHERRDGHLKSDDFFNAEEFPQLKFSGKIEKDGDGHALVGELTIRDITKPIRFDVEHGGTIDGRRGKKAGFTIQGDINRFDYNLKFDRAMPGGDLVVGKSVNIVCNVEINEVVAEEGGEEKK